MRTAAHLHTEMWRLIVAYRISRSIGIAVELGIPELLAGEGRTAAQVAAETSTHEPSVRRLLRALVVLEVLAEDDSGRFGLTALGEELRADKLGPLARFLDGQLHWKSWQHFDHSIKTGERGFDHEYGMRDWDYYAGHPADAAIFDAAMRSMTTPVAAAVASAYDFSDTGLVADIGGGDGTLLIAVLERNPHVRGLLFDRPHVLERSRKRIEEASLTGRTELVGGSFFDEIPSGADVYIMKSVIHDWEDDEAVAILSRCRAAAGSTGARLLLVERLISDRISPRDFDAVMSDLNMLVNPGGRERTTSEYARLLAQGGYALTRTLPVDTQFHIVEARPA